MPWSVFVEYVIDVTVEAYEKMNIEKQLHKTWHEETLSAILAEDYIEQVANSRPGPHLIVSTEVRVVKDEMKSGSEHIRTAQKIDIKMFGSWQKNHREHYFAWECKKIADRETGGNLITEYVSEGIHRFCDGAYSVDVETAGMIGYVIGGEVPKLVEDINSSLTSSRRERRLPEVEKLFASVQRRSLEHIYESNHARSTSSNIKLFHLFLELNWLEEIPDDDTEVSA